MSVMFFPNAREWLRGLLAVDVLRLEPDETMKIIDRIREADPSVPWIYDPHMCRWRPKHSEGAVYIFRQRAVRMFGRSWDVWTARFHDDRQYFADLGQAARWIRHKRRERAAYLRGE